MNTLSFVFRLVAGTIELGVWCTKDSITCLVGYNDLDWVGDVDDRKNISGGVTSYEITWFHVLVRSKTVCYYPQQNLSTLQLQVVVYNFCGSNKCLMIMTCNL